jgi:hypothetical protein
MKKASYMAIDEEIMAPVVAKLKETLDVTAGFVATDEGITWTITAKEKTK